MAGELPLRACEVRSCLVRPGRLRRGYTLRLRRSCRLREVGRHRGEPSVRTCHSSPGLAPGNFLSAGETRLVTAPVSPIPCGSELRAARPLSPRVQLQRAPVASPVVVRETAAMCGGHMRPNTAAALRRLGTSKLVAKLAMDESEYALLPRQKERLSSIVQAVAAAKLAAIPFNTAKADDNGVRWLGLVCEDLDTTPLRPGPEHAFEDREALLGAHFICFHSEHAKVNAHFAITPSGAQRTRVKPSSSFSAYLAARRALEDYGSYVPPMKPVLKVLKGLDKQMLLEFGEDALAKIQALPWSTSHLDAFQSALVSGEKLQWHRAKCDMCHCMLAFALGVACRKEESPRYKRSNVTWFTARLVEVVLDREGIAGLCNACFCRVRPVSSKTDQNNVEWGNHYMWFRVDTSSWWSLAAALMWIEQTYFVEPQHRLATTLFFNPEVAGFVPFSLSVMAAMLNELMVAAGIIVAAASVYDRYTWHSARVTLACQLRKLQYGWDRITSHLRHKSAESARIYGRLDAIGYADTAAKASQADASGILAADLPEIDPVTKHAGMQDAIAAMEAMVVDADKLSEKRRGEATSVHRTSRSERPSRS